MRIISLDVANVLKVKAVHLEPDGSVTIIGGNNKQGKSSVLTAIEMCLAGADAIPPEPLRRGAKRGHARLDLGDIIVERRFTREGTTLIVKNADGSPAKSPIDGLGFDENGVTFNGLPFEQCSSAESIEVSMAIGLAINPKLPVVLIKHGSLIDPVQLEIVRTMAEQHNPPAQVIVERVGEGTECSVIIEDGHVKGEEVAEAPEEPEAATVGETVGSGEGP